jgi:hypothetical protein
MLDGEENKVRQNFLGKNTIIMPFTTHRLFFGLTFNIKNVAYVLAENSKRIAFRKK